MDPNQILTTAFFVTWLAAAIRLAGPVLLAALGETFGELSGVLNIGIEGTILLGALSSFLIALETNSAVAGLLSAILTGTAASVFLGWMYVRVKANQVVVGIIFNMLALGLSSYIYRAILGQQARPQRIPMFRPIDYPSSQICRMSAPYSSSILSSSI